MMRAFRRLVGALALIVFAAAAGAQGIQLTPEQQQILNSLPPDQRTRAMAAIRDLQAQQSIPVSSINEANDDAQSRQVDTPLTDMRTADSELRADAGSQLVLTFSVSDTVSDIEASTLRGNPVLERLIGSSLFVLNDAGILELPGLEPIPLLGLNADDIVRRLQAEPPLAPFSIGARLLDQRPIGVEALKPFGYDVFQADQAGFDAPASGPVPSDYVLGPGDTVRVQYFGNVSSLGEYEVSRDGVLNLPELGPVAVAGMSFSQLRTELDRRVSEMLIGTQVSVSMGPLKNIRVFVLGDVVRPGSYVVSGLATVTSALYESGGVSDIGSLRDIQLKRGGSLVSRLDLYDLLIDGDTSNDARLMQGDVIFVPPIGQTIAVSGAVRRPAIYETDEDGTIADAVVLAGGLAAEAFPQGARVERIGEDFERSVKPVDLTSDQDGALAVMDGDVLIVPEVLPDIANAIRLSGHVHRPGAYPWQPGMRLTDLIPSVQELRDGVDMKYVLIRRQTFQGQPVEALSTSLDDAIATRGSDADVQLVPRDEIHVFSLDLGRQQVVRPLIQELERQATYDRPARIVEIEGNVRAPGVYPLEAGMRISDLLRAGGHLRAEAYTLEAELTRYTVVDDGLRVVETRKIDLRAILDGDQSADLALEPYDYVGITQVPEWQSAWTVSIEGEVRFPGSYRVGRGETLREVLQRAGGLTGSAFPEGAVFLRETLREREQEQIEMLARRLESDLTALSLQLAETAGSETMSTGRSLLDQLRSTEAAGRLVIDPGYLMTGVGSDWGVDVIELRDGDRLLVPQRSQVVTVIGETQQNTSHLYEPDLGRDDYVNMSGGFTRRADRSRIYIVRANGAVVTGNRSQWFGRGGREEIRPGDTIVVPLDADRMRPITFWTSVTQILYQGAIAVAAIQSFE